MNSIPKNVSSSTSTGGTRFSIVDDALRGMRNYAWIVVLATGLGAGFAAGFSLLQTPHYEASISVLVGGKSGVVDDPTDATGFADVTKTMAYAVPTRPVAEEVIRRLDLDISPEEFLEDRLSVAQVEDTQFVRVSYTDSDPLTARLVADTIGEVFSERIREVAPEAANVAAVTATVWERAAVPKEPISSPQPVYNVAIGMFVGALLGIGASFLLERLGHGCRSPEEAERISGVPTMGVVERFEAPVGTHRSKADR